MGEVYTYYTRGHDPEVEAGPLSPRGRAWVRGRYTPPTYPSALNVRVGEAGIKVWMVIQWLGFYGGDIGHMLDSYGHVLTRDDVETAIWFYKNNQVDTAEIDRKIAEEAA